MVEEEEPNKYYFRWVLRWRSCTNRICCSNNTKYRNWTCNGRAGFPMDSKPYLESCLTLQKRLYQSRYSNATGNCYGNEISPHNCRDNSDDGHIQYSSILIQILLVILTENKSVRLIAGTTLMMVIFSILTAIVKQFGLIYLVTAGVFGS